MSKHFCEEEGGLQVCRRGGLRGRFECIIDGERYCTRQLLCQHSDQQFPALVTSIWVLCSQTPIWKALCNYCPHFLSL